MEKKPVKEIYHEIRSLAASKRLFAYLLSFPLHSFSWLCSRLICHFWMLDFVENCWYSTDKVKYKAMTPVIQSSQRLNVKWPKVGKMCSAIGFGKIAKIYLTVGSFEAFQCQRGLNLEHKTNKEALGAPWSVSNHVTLRAISLDSSQNECHCISTCDYTVLKLDKQMFYIILKS